jgi:hypothetical protein
MAFSQKFLLRDLLAVGKIAKQFCACPVVSFALLLGLVGIGILLKESSDIVQQTPPDFVLINQSYAWRSQRWI